jgi:hypothetical protein
MDIRHLTSIILVTLCTLPFIAQADVIKIAQNSAQVIERIDTPRRGTNKASVLKRYGKPQSRLAGVGTPSISSWSYGNFDIYFERNLVLHTVARQK